MKMVAEYHKNGWTVLQMSGLNYVGEVSSAVLEEQLLAWSTDTNGIILDMQEVTFVDSNAMGAMFSARKKLTQKNKDLLLAGVRPSVLSVLRIVHLDEVFDIFPDVDAAIASRSSKGA